MATRRSRHARHVQTCHVVAAAAAGAGSIRVQRQYCLLSAEHAMLFTIRRARAHTAPPCCNGEETPRAGMQGAPRLKAFL